MSVARRLWLALALNATLLLALVGQHVRTIDRAVSAAEALSEVSAQVVLAQSEQGTRLALLEETAAKFAVTRDAGYRSKAMELVTAVDEQVAAVGALPLATAERQAHDALVASWRAAQAPLSEATAVAAARRLRVPAPSLDGLVASLAATREASDAVAHAARETMRARLLDAARERERAVRRSWLAALVAAALVLVTVLALRRAITRPLAALTAGTRALAGGDFAHRVLVPDRGEFAAVASSFNDMSARLGALDRMKRDFVTTISHDLKSPLASLRETTALLLDEVPGPLSDAQRRVLLLQRDSADRLGRMIAKLLDLSRLEAGLPLNRSDVRLATLLGNAVAHADATGRARRVRVELAPVPPPTLRVHADEDRLQQLVDNLLENAVKFSPADSTVTVTAALLPGEGSRGRAVRLTVADRGPGVEPADATRIFERFVQTRTGRSVAQSGVGIGLTICREVVQSHGGRLGVTPREGGGSTFWVELPDAEIAPRPEAIARPVATTHPLPSA